MKRKTPPFGPHCEHHPNHRKKNSVSLDAPRSHGMVRVEDQLSQLEIEPMSAPIDLLEARQDQVLEEFGLMLAVANPDREEFKKACSVAVDAGTGTLTITVDLKAIS